MKMAKVPVRAYGLARGLAVHRRYRDYTMIPPLIFAANLDLCRRLAPKGCIVECGVWRGGMSAGMSHALPGRHHFLFDSFEGLPKASEIDGAAAKRWQEDVTSRHYHNNCGAESSFAVSAMSRSRARDYTLMPGWFDKTMVGFEPQEPIAVLRLDGDWYESTMVCLESLYPHVIDGGLILIDDYYTWDGCARAVHDYLSHHSLPVRIERTHGVCHITKRTTA